MTGVSEDKNKDDIERPSSVNMSSYSGDCRARRNSVLNEFLVKAYAKQIRERNTNTGTSPTVQYRKIHMRVLNRPATVSCMFNVHAREGALTCLAACLLRYFPVERPN
jgi:hypothetical protein